MKGKNLNDEKPLIIVLSRNYSTGLGVIRSLGIAGYDVDVIAAVKQKGSSTILSRSKYAGQVTEVLVKDIKRDSGTGIVKVLKGYADAYDKKMLLIPTDDFTASVIDDNREVLSGLFMMPHISEAGVCAGFSINKLMEKCYQSECARKAGLLTPDECVIPLYIEEIMVPGDVEYPCFVKPLKSADGLKTEMSVCENRNELYACLKNMQCEYRERSVLVQQYLKIDKEYNLSGVCLDQKILIPAVMEKIKIAQFERGVGMNVKVLTTDSLQGYIEKIKKMMQSFHYVGMFDIDMYLCGNRIYFSEINFRSGGSNFAYFLSGINMPEVFAKYVLEEEPELNTKVDKGKLGKVFVNEKIAWEDYIYKHITKKELRECIKNADYKLLEFEEDPEPGRYFNMRIRLSAAKHRLKSII